MSDLPLLHHFGDQHSRLQVVQPFANQLFIRIVDTDSVFIHDKSISTSRRVYIIKKALQFLQVEVQAQHQFSFVGLHRV
ncbi:hypothetical protein D3C85_1365310 [compost metagenome]